MADKALSGVRVVDLASWIAAPFAATLLAEFGAEVIKVEHPQRGDAQRGLQPFLDDHSLYWSVCARNKKCVTCDLSTPQGQEIVKQLAKVSDVVVENFRPGTLERWGLGWEDLRAIKPALVMLRATAYGQDGPYRDYPGFGSAAEGISGATYITGYPDQPPVRPCFPMGDYVTGLFGAFSVMVALYYRDVNGGKGQWIDAAIYESLFRVLEFLFVEYDRLGEVRERTGNLVPGTAPSDAFQSKDGKWISFRAASDFMFARFSKLIDRQDLLQDPRYATMKQRWENREPLHALVREWIAQRDTREITAVLNEAGVPAMPIYSVADIAEDPHFRARNMIIEVADKLLGPLRMQAVVPKLSETPGTVEWPGPQQLGEHNQEVYCGLLGYSAADLAALKAAGVV
ncbi:MAG: CoA transferase [Chloroflexi bacterium]|nr:CoA transferase [Chloroflexota bacterium]